MRERSAYLRYFALTLSIAVFINGCVVLEISPTDAHTELEQVYPELDPGIRDFFADEATAAGVRQIRAMTVGETPKRWSRQQSGCAQTIFESRLILINTERSRCLDLDHLAHEIAHIGVLRTHCYGHGDRFYDYNRGIAERFEARFRRQEERAGWVAPVRSVLDRETVYRSGAERCL